MKRKNVFWLAVGVLLLFGSFPMASAKNNLKTVSATVASNLLMLLNGEVWQPKDQKGERVYPVIINGSSYLPVRVLSEALDVDIQWDSAAQTIKIGEGTSSVQGTSSIDLTQLPLGDGKYTLMGPQKGYIYLASPPRGGDGAYKQGEWINTSEGTFDMTQKAVVDGAVKWESELTIELKGKDRILTGNRLPDHATGRFPIDPSDDAYRYDRNPNSIKEKLFQVVLPAKPLEASKASPVTPGAIGVMLTGSLIFNGLDAAGRDAVAHETQDGCYGHPEKDGSYHYHNLSACVDDPLTGKHSKLVGYALDGFGIYGKYGENGKLVTNEDLDSFHGHSHLIEWDGERVEMYHYHTTVEFPYTIGAFKGTPVRQGLTYF